tara:strand:+ start:126 stop:629 length:504 start_codon:yes stop_codon:yes gene_type:complete
MANIKLGDSTVITETDGVATIPNDVIGGQGLFSGPDTSASLLQNATMVKDTSLPVFAIRAYCFFDATQRSTVGSETHCQIQACGNISKVVRNSASKYTAYFETPMPDNKYIVTGSANPNDYSGCYFGVDYAAASGKLSYLTDRFSIDTRDTSNSTTESNYITFIVVR